MSRFLQLHLLTSFPPANLNRDDLGRPKTAKMGGVDRLRVSSQSLKRAWRTSELFQRSLAGHVGTRTKLLGVKAYEKLIAAGVPEKDAKTWAKSIAGVFGALKREDKNKPLQDLEIEQLVHVGPAELQAVEALLETLAAGRRAPTDDELELLRKPQQAVDIALFGRMLAARPTYNVEAACQVAHAISVHPVTVEDDYFTAVDDLNEGQEDVGAGHIGETGFAAALFYSYLCINRELLVQNLGGEESLARRALSALVETAIKVAPEGKQNSFGSRAYASYVLAELGDQQPRSLSVAFLRPIQGSNYGEDAIRALQNTYQNMDQVYGPCADDRYVIDTFRGQGRLQELLAFVTR